MILMYLTVVGRRRGCFQIMDFACDIDPGPYLSVGEFGRSLGRFLAGIHSRVARPSGSGGLGLYKCWSRERDATSISTGDRVTPLRTSCQSWDCVVGATPATWTSAVDYSC